MSKQIYLLLLLSAMLLVSGCNNSPQETGLQDNSATSPAGAGGPPGGPPGGVPLGGRPGGRSMMGGGSAMGILMNQEARDALGISEDQLQKLTEAVQATITSPQPGQQPDFAAMREQMQKMQAETRKILEADLTADQLAKLDVMIFQSSGGLNPPAPNAGPGGGRGGFGSSISVESLRALNLTDEQKEKVQAAQDKMTEASRLPQGTNPQDMTQEERQARQEAGQKLREELMAEVTEILTDEQKAQAEELMTDVPQYLQRPAPEQGGPGGGRRPPGN